jgi:hypothetical protein
MRQDKIVLGIEENRKHQRAREANKPLFNVQSGLVLLFLVGDCYGRVVEEN